MKSKLSFIVLCSLMFLFSCNEKNKNLSLVEVLESSEVFKGYLIADKNCEDFVVSGKFNSVVTELQNLRKDKGYSFSYCDDDWSEYSRLLQEYSALKCEWKKSLNQVKVEHPEFFILPSDEGLKLKNELRQKWDLETDVALGLDNVLAE